MRLFAEIDGTNALATPPRSRLARPRSQPPRNHGTETTLGEVEHKIHRVLDQQDRDIRRERGKGRENVLPLVLRHASGGFVKQQHPRSRSQREDNLEEPLLAIRELPRRAGPSRPEAETR